MAPLVFLFSVQCLAMDGVFPKRCCCFFFLLSRKTVTEFTNLTAGFICLFVLNVSLITVEKLKGTEGEWLVGKHVQVGSVFITEVSIPAEKHLATSLRCLHGKLALLNT